MSNPLVSVIVPVYNVEKYIKECLDSISAQNYKNLEIIVVDDGTLDKSGKIADECAQNDNRIRVIHKKNGGVSTARNIGLDLASGEYIIFVDSDDYLTVDYTDYMLKLINDTDADMAVSLNVFNEHTTEQVVDDRFEIYSPVIATQELYLYRIGVACWNKIDRRSFLENQKMRFCEDLWFGEGTTFSIIAFQRANHVGVGHRRVYFQRSNPESAVRKFNLKSWECGFKSLERQKDSFAFADKKVIRAWNFHFWWSAFSVYREIMKIEEKKEYTGELKKYARLMRKNTISPFMVPISRKYKLFAIIMFLSPKLASEIIKNRERKVVAQNERAKTLS